MKTLTATDVARNFSTVLDDVEQGETIIVTRGGRSIAAIGPAPGYPGRALKEVLRQHRPDDRWADDLRRVRDLAGAEEPAWPDA